MTDNASQRQAYGLYINGQESAADGGELLPVIDPATGHTWATIIDASDAQVEEAIGAAHSAFQNEWSRLRPSQRGSLLWRLADVIERHAPHLAEIEVRDNGKLLREMRAQLDAIPKWYRYFAGLADKIHGETIPMDRASLVNFTLREPLGVIGCLTPWNSPLLLGTWKFAPALAAGNTLVVKPSEHASVSTLEFARCFEEAGFPPGVFNVVTGRGAGAGSALARNRMVSRVCFTGSGAAGAEVAAAAVRHFADVSLELGGKSANIVFADAPRDAAFAGVISGIFAAAGQTCVAGSRLLVQRPLLDEFSQRLADRAKTVRLGNPLASETEMGPIANAPQLARVTDYVEIARRDGGTILTGGERCASGDLVDGYFYPPTVIADIRNDMRIAQEEVFGPVLCILPFDDEEEAIALANDSPYGLAAGVWTDNLTRAHRLVRALEAGMVWVNTYRSVAQNMPFGGVKGSGSGRENGREAAEHFTRTKSVWIELEPAVGDPFTIRVG